MSTEYLFMKFLEIPEEFDNARKYWCSLCDRVLMKYGQSGLWKRIPQEELSGDRAQLRDCNPIHSLINFDQLKSVVIIQQDPGIHRKWEMAAWVNIFGDEFSKPGPIKELVFTCNLTQQSAATFKKLFETWIQPACQVPVIQEQIGELIKSQE